MLAIARVFRDKGPEAFHDFGNGLEIFRLTRIMLGYISTEFLKTLVFHCAPPRNKTILPKVCILPNYLLNSHCYLYFSECIPNCCNFLSSAAIAALRRTVFEGAYHR